MTYAPDQSHVTDPEQQFLYYLFTGEVSEDWHRYPIIKQTAKFIYVDRNIYDHKTIYCPYDTAENYLPEWQRQWKRSFKPSYQEPLVRIPRAVLLTGKYYHRPSRIYFDTLANYLIWWRDHAWRFRRIVPQCLRDLQLDADASKRDVERAYRQLVLKCHPDQGGDAAEFKRVQMAYEQALQIVS